MDEEDVILADERWKRADLNLARMWELRSIFAVCDRAPSEIKLAEAILWAQIVLYSLGRLRSIFSDLGEEGYITDTIADELFKRWKGLVQDIEELLLKAYKRKIKEAPRRT